MRGKTIITKWRGRHNKIKVRYLIVAVGVIISGAAFRHTVQAAECPDVRIIFARGSGGEQDKSSDYLEFKSTIEEKLRTTRLSYDFVDLEYPAVGIGFSDLETATTTLGAYVSGGEAYNFGRSMWAGVNNLQKYATDASCPNTKFVLGGYSQGAMVLINSLYSFGPDRIIYAATFGDPKIYLPEGNGIMPPACRGESLSDYRMYVPDCQAYKGILGAYVPYEPDEFAGKLGTWCNGGDILCSSHLSIADHTEYVSQGLYEDASRVIFDKICKTFGIENTVSSPHDTAILIDTTGSMSSWIGSYKTEALRLAQETLNSGGRVALYDYRDLDDPYDVTKRCDFESCTLERFTSELDNIMTDGGGDEPESLLSASVKMMSELEWQHGATKSVVVLTDANYLSPDRDGITLNDAVSLSKRIDPVNFYIITREELAGDYAELARLTDGKVVTNFGELELLTDYIMGRYDSLPRAEETEPAILPTVEIIDTATMDSTGSATVRFHSSAGRTLLILDDTLLGITEEETITVTDLIDAAPNKLQLVPLNDNVRGESVSVMLSRCHGKAYCPPEEESMGSLNAEGVDSSNTSKPVILKAPNTGRL